MKYNIVGFTLAITILFTGCIEDSKLVFQESNITTIDNTIVEINIPKASGDIQIASKINSVIESRIISSLQSNGIDETNKISIEESITSFNNEFTTFKSDFPNSAQQWEAQIDGEIMYQSTEIISIALTTYINTGGAHGNLVISFLNFDTRIGELISNDKLFSDLKSFKKIAEPYYKKEIENKEAIFNKHANFEFPKNIGFNEEGVILLYNTYEIASYSTGIIEFTIPFEDTLEFLNFN